MGGGGSTADGGGGGRREGGEQQQKKPLQKTKLTANSQLNTFLYVDKPSILVNSLQLLQLDCSSNVLASIKKKFYLFILLSLSLS